MPVLRVNPKLDFAANLRLNGIDPVDFIRDYNTAIASVYLPVTEGSGDITLGKNKSPATRGGSKYRNFRNTRRLRGGAEDNSGKKSTRSSTVLRTVCVLAMVVGVVGLVYAAGDYAGVAPSLNIVRNTAARTARDLGDVAGTCSLSGIQQQAERAGGLAVAEWSSGWSGFLNMLGDSSLGGPGAGFARLHVERAASALAKEAAEASCSSIAQAARDAAAQLLTLNAQVVFDQKVGAAAGCVFVLGSFIKKRITAGNANYNAEITEQGAWEELQEKEAKEAKEKANRIAAGEEAEAASGGGPSADDDELLFDTSEPENVSFINKAEGAYLGAEKMKAASVRSILSLVGAAEPVTSIAGQKAPSDLTPNAPKQGGGMPEVSYIEMKKTLALIGVLPGVIDQILARSDNPSLSEPAKANISK
jgi:hypothetical protein